MLQSMGSLESDVTERLNRLPFYPLPLSSSCVYSFTHSQSQKAVYTCLNTTFLKMTSALMQSQYIRLAPALKVAAN